MVIAVPATACGAPEPASVLDLEPLIAFLRQCRADAVSLLPPAGPDDLPNGAALAAMRDRLSGEGFGTVGGAWRVPESAPVADEAWQVQAAFEVRSLLAAMGEAGVSPFLLDWRPAQITELEDLEPLRALLGRIADEAARSRVKVGVLAPLSPSRLRALIADVGESCLGLALSLEDVAQVSERASIVAVEAGPGGFPPTAATSPALRALPGDSTVYLTGLESPLTYARAVGFLQGLTASG